MSLTSRDCILTSESGVVRMLCGLPGHVGINAGVIVYIVSDLNVLCESAAISPWSINEREC